MYVFVKEPVDGSISNSIVGSSPVMSTTYSRFMDRADATESSSLLRFPAYRKRVVRLQEELLFSLFANAKRLFEVLQETFERLRDFAFFK